MPRKDAIRRQLINTIPYLFFLSVCFMFILCRTALATEVTIDSDVHTTSTSHNGSTPTTVFISDQTGYTFYRDSNGTCVYRKTTNGGTSWGPPVTVDSQTDCLGVGVWYDRWTPGDTTGTSIHIVTFDSGSDDLWYTRLDTSNDTLTTTVNATGDNQGGTFAAGSNLPSITKGTDGVLYMGIQDNSDSFVIKSANGTTWTEAGDNPFDRANDFLILMPLSGGNIMAIRWDISADDIQSKVYNAKTNKWDDSWTNIDTNAADNTTYDGAFGATVDKATGKIYLAYAADIDILGTDDDIRTAVYSGGAWTSKTDVLTDDSKGITGVKISFDENTGDVYVVYSARTTAGAANTGNVYWKKSTDGMTTWGAEQGPVNTTADDIYGARVNIMSNERIYVTWYATPDDLFGNTIADLVPPSPPPPPPRVTLTINSTSPSAGAIDVAVDTSVSATFSMLMNGSTLTTDTFQVKKGSDDVAGTVTTNAMTATFTPLANLDYNTVYTARVTTGAQAANFAGTTLDNDYVWSFTTTADADPPTVSTTSPLNGAAGVAITSTITATFSEAMQSSTINTNTFTVSDESGNNISGTVSYNGTTAVFTPSANLSDSTTYTARITTGVKDLAGNAMASDYTWSFTTVDTTLPTVISTSPVNGATGVAISTTITATFSEAMQASTINTNTFTVSDGSGNISGTVSYSGTTATFTPSRSLSDSTTYTARITTGVKDLAGNAMASDYTWSFTTVDTTLPTVISTSPVNGATGVAISTTITATFSEAMQASTINTNTFTVSDGSGNISGTVSYSGTTATFTPSRSLSDSTTYTARITTGVKDLAGNAMASDYTWGFATGDFTAPMVISTNPVNGATGVEINSAITATFSEAMQASTINTNTFTVSDGSGNISGTVSYSGTTATFTPSRSLSDSTTYTARITTGVKDLAGNAMASDYTWRFTTVDTTLPTVISTSPVNGATGVAINSTITAAFSEAMQSSTINTNTFTVSDGSGNISGTVSYSGTTATFTPSGNLSHSTAYTAKITTGARDLAGNALASDYTWGFTTTGDFIAPTVISTSPVNGDAGVAINRSITATFSEAMQSSTITTDTFAVNDGIGSISGTVSYHGTTAAFTPSSNLSTYTTYTARITTGVRDLNGNALASPYTWSFTTSGDVDIIPPVVSSTSPVNGAAGVDVSSIITATFSEAMDASTIITDTFIVNNGSIDIGGTVSYSDMTATFTPSNNLSSYTTYTARITKGVRDLVGNAMASDYTWSFTTTGDFVAPKVISTSPANGAAGVDVSSIITATFSEVMDATAITTETFIVNNGSSDISGTVAYSDTTATFTPSANLDFNTIYTATITTRARDLAGNTMASAYTWSFTTGLAPITPTPIPTATPTPTPTATPTPTPMATPTPTPTQTSNLYLSKETAYLDGDTIVVTVVDADRNTSMISADILTTALKATALNYYAGGDLTLDLKENAVNSGTFLATIKTGTDTAGGASSSVRSNIGAIKAVQGGSAAVIYTDTAPYASSLIKTLTFSSFDATLSFDADAYFVESYTKITLADAERNTNHTEAESLLNEVYIETSSINNTKVMMVETGADTGTFMGSIQIVTSGGTLEFERIQASAGDTLKITYIDEINTTGFPRIVTDTAFVTGEITPTPTPTPTTIPTITPTPSATPTPGVCNAELITVSPKKLKLKKEESDDVMVLLTGEGDCPVEGEIIKAKITKGKRLITVSPTSAITDDNGQAEFTITALKKTGNAKVKFKSGNVKTILKVEVVK